MSMYAINRFPGPFCLAIIEKLHVCDEKTDEQTDTQTNRKHT